MSECAQQSPNQGRLARAEVAREVNYEPGLKRRGQCGAGCLGIGFIGQMCRKAATAIICRMNKPDHVESSDESLAALVQKIRAWGRELGFDAVTVTGVGLADAETGLAQWLASGFHGEMDYMARHGMMRARPAELVPGTLRVISVRMNYWPRAADAKETLADGRKAYISRYALGRDYHKPMRRRLQSLADRIASAAPHAYRVFVDSAPVLEVELARRGGTGWRGKHSLLIDRSAGSYFFLGEIFTDLPLPVDAPVGEHCGSCRACIDACPTGAIVGPYRVDARRCISYLTIELKGAIPEPMRPLVGNRIYGCDDCQLACPWNRFAGLTAEPDFEPRHGLDGTDLAELFAWTESEFTTRMAGSAIYRIGYERWSRNLAVALGNAPRSAEAIAALRSRRSDPSPLVREHVEWALARHGIGPSPGHSGIGSGPHGT